MRVVVDGLAWISKEDISEHQLNSYKHILTIIPKKSVKKGPDPVPLVLYKESDTHFGMPREYYFEHRYKQTDRVVYKITNGCLDEFPDGLQFSDKENLTDEQQKACDSIVNYLDSGRMGGMFQAPPGAGKTVALCYISSRLKVPTVVLVHKGFLLRQWKERIERFLPNAKIGVIQGKTVDYHGKDIVIAMVQTLTNNKIPEDFYKWPGFVVADEARHMGSTLWSQLFEKFPCRYRMGLDGTPQRNDLCDAAFFYHIGPKIYVIKEKRLPFKVRRVRTDFELTGFTEKQLKKMDKCKKIDLMVVDTARNQVIVEQIAMAAYADRNIIVLSERRDHLKLIEDMYKKTYLNKYRDKIMPESSLFIGGMKGEAQDEALTKQVLFATYQIAREALDVARLDTLFLTTPTGDLAQAAGRIRRTYYGKKDPVIVDIRDENVGWCRYLANERELFYRKEGSNHLLDKK